ncbi:MAG TPA: ATP phosphoribosyltransferase regulatory subunit [Candidatus Absconditabacterales bacterium]|nr:ATP phosphoribosyltransferase regulatory subunit [Candidatus Absconditabacterales bacterium]
MAQGGEDTKDYALHFDLTVPFARYVLDWKNDLAFPFKRYQIQPVWRGERSQKGRYKEFWQADIDTIRPSSQNSPEINSFYAIETVSTLGKTISQIFSHFNLSKKFSIRLSHKQFLKGLIDGLGEKNPQAMISFLDKFYKLTPEIQAQEIQKFPGLAEALSALIANQIDQLPSAIRENNDFQQGRNTIQTVIQTIHDLYPEIKILFDPTIVRGLDYYTGIVFETFIEERLDLGSFCSGGAYENFTDFIDAKHSLSGIGGSIGLSRLFSILTEDFAIQPASEDDSYMVMHFEGMTNDALHLASQFQKANKSAFVYPSPVKLGKQFEYAQKKGVTSVVICGEAEKLSNTFKIKNLNSGKGTTLFFEEAFGIIPVYKDSSEKKILLIKNKNGGHRGFPKGRPDESDRNAQHSALRELAEETGITDCQIVEKNNQPLIFTENYLVPGKKLKQVTYFVGLVSSLTTNLQESEIADARRCELSEALELISFPEAKALVSQLAKLGEEI